MYTRICAQTQTYVYIYIYIYIYSESARERQRMERDRKLLKNIGQVDWKVKFTINKSEN